MVVLVYQCNGRDPSISSISRHLPCSVLQMQQMTSTSSVEVVDETAAAVWNGSAAVAATDGSTLHPMFADIDDDEYTDSVLEIQR